MNLGKSIKILLIREGINQVELAERLNKQAKEESRPLKAKYSRQQISHWCRTGKIPDYHLMAVCDLFEMKASELVALGE